MIRLFHAPHRLFFFAGACALLAQSAWWLAAMAMRSLGLPPPSNGELAPAPLHAFAMLYGFFPLFIFGFLLTAGPRWLRVPPPRPPQYAPAGIGAGLAATLLVPAFMLGPIAAMALVAAMLSTWTPLWWHFARLVAASGERDRLHPILAAIALALAIAGLGAMGVWLATGESGAANAMEHIGLWAFLVPLFCTMAHRMVPFFSGDTPAQTPSRGWGAPLGLLVGGSLIHGALSFAGVGRWTWIVDAPLAALVLGTAGRWIASHRLANRLLAMLFIGYLWLGAAWLLFAVQSLLALSGVQALGLAPLHALAMGFLSSFTLALVGRVSAARAGLGFSRERLATGAFVLLQMATLARVAADAWNEQYGGLVLAAATLWLACFAAWAWHFVPLYWKPSPPRRQSIPVRKRGAPRG